MPIRSPSAAIIYRAWLHDCARMVGAIPPGPLVLVAAGPPPAAVVDAALDSIVNGTLREFLRELVPAARRQLLEALRTEHAAEFAQAKRWLADDLADQTLEIADDRSIPVDRARLMIEARQRRCAQLDPSTYGDRKYIEHSGTVTLRHEVSPCAPSPASPPAPATSSRSQTSAATTTRRRSSKC